jgi:hypothetical protein
VRLLTSTRYRRVRHGLQSAYVAALSCITAVVCFTSIASAQTPAALPNLTGTYKCEGDETACGWSGETFIVTQSGAVLDVKNEKGDVGQAKLTSPISISLGPTWNMLGTIVSSDNRVIQWSNGTNWRKTMSRTTLDSAQSPKQARAFRDRAPALRQIANWNEPCC